MDFPKRSGTMYGSKAGKYFNNDTSESAELEEEFPDPIVPDLSLAHNWTVWEHYESKGGADYSKTMTKVAWFGDAITFWQVWNKIPHSDPSNFFSYKDNGVTYANHYDVNGLESQVASLSLFKTGIRPEWEDPLNHKGGEFTLKVGSTKENTRNIWNNLALDVISDNFPH